MLGLPKGLPQERPRTAILRAGALAMGRRSLVRELWDFMRVRKKWWLAPLLLILVLLGGLLIFAQTSALAPFIYTLF